jgi:CheY-like chemotaxis protein
MKTILFVDDKGSIREYCRAALEDEGYRVLLACDGLDAIRVFFEEYPDLVVLDINMPRMNGLEALQRIRSAAPLIPVILFTAHDDECLRDPRASLASACIGKDEDLNNLKRMIASMLTAAGSQGCPIASRVGLPPIPLGASPKESASALPG